MITLFSQKHNTLCQDLQNNSEISVNKQEYIQNLMPTTVNNNCKCPGCSAKNRFSRHGVYTRNFSLILNLVLENYKVEVTRLICNSCGSTHALLPSFIVPYKIMALHSILSVIQEASTTSVLETAERLQISYQMIYIYLLIFKSFFSNVFILNNMNTYSTNLNEKYFFTNALSFCNQNFLIDFFKVYRWVFLMNKFRNISPRKVYVGSFLVEPHKICIDFC